MTLREQLIRDEGLRLRPYRDSVGKLTIGVGRNLDDVGISLAEAEMLLDSDISRSAASVLAHIPWAINLDQVRRDALTNMAFNLGIGDADQGTGLLGFKKFLAYAERSEWEKAAEEMLQSKWHRQVGVRAVRLAEQMISGEYR